MSGKSRFQQRKTRRYVLEWPEGDEMGDAKVTLRAMRLGELERLMSLHEEFKGSSEEDDSGGKLKVFSAMVDGIAKALVSWNIPDTDTMGWDEVEEEYIETADTKLLPANADGLRSLEDWEFMAIFNSYLAAAVGVSEDLGKGSSSGASSLAELPMTEQ